MINNSKIGAKIPIVFEKIFFIIIDQPKTASPLRHRKERVFPRQGSLFSLLHFYLSLNIIERISLRKRDALGFASDSQM